MQEATNQGNTLPKFENTKQKRIYNNLCELIGPAPAAFYQDACYIMKNSSEFNTASHIVAHQLREIEGFLFDALSVIPNEKPRSIDLNELKEDLIEIADSIPYETSRLSNIEIDARLNELKKQLNGELKLIGSVLSTKKDKATSILDGLQIQDKELVLKAWSVELQGHAHRRYLDGPRKIDDKFKKIFDEKENLFDIILEALRNHYLKYIQRLDELLSKSNPTNEDINLLQKNIPSNLLTRSYFFNRLDKASWLKPLRKAGFFKIRPIPVINDENGFVTTYSWPESKYLLIMSRSEPEVISDIILKEVPYVENIWVLEDLIDALIQMPPKISCRTVDRIIDWSKLIYPSLLPKKMGELIIHFAKCGKIEHALRLAKTSLEVMPDPQNKNYSIKNGDYLHSPKPQSRFDLYDFKQILNEIFPEFIEIAGFKAFDLLCEMLESAILLSQRGPDEGIKDISYSVFWRPHIDRPSSRETLKSLTQNKIHKFIL